MTDYKQIIIAQIGSSSPAPFFNGHTGLIWWRDLYLTQEQQDASFWTVNFGGTYDDLEDDTVIINTVTWNGQQLTRYNSINELYFPAVSEAFFFDLAAQRLYIKNFGPNYPPWQTKGTSVGIVLGLSSAADVGRDKRPINQAFFGIDHQPRVIASGVSDEQRIDNWSENLMQFLNVSLSLINDDGEFDQIRDDIINQRADLLLAEVPDGQMVDDPDFRIVSSGVIDTVEFPDDKTVSIQAVDRRKSWEDTVPDTYYEVGFGGLDSENSLLDQNMALVIGRVYRLPLQPTDPDNGVYHIGMASVENPLEAVEGVYLEKDGVYTLISPGAYTVDLTTGLLTFGSPATTDDGSPCAQVIGIRAPAIATGGNGNNPIDIAVMLIEEYGGLPFLPSNFDLDTIRAIALERDYEAGIYIPPGGTELKQLIDELTFSINSVFYQKGNVLSMLSMTVEIPEQTQSVYADEMPSPPAIAYNSDDYMSRINVGFSRDYQVDGWLWSLNRDLEPEAVAAYQYKVQYDFETQLFNKADADIMGLERYLYSYLLVPELETQSNIPLGFSLGDVVDFDYEIHGRRRFDPARYRVEAISRIRRTYSLRYLEDVT